MTGNKVKMYYTYETAFGNMVSGYYTLSSCVGSDGSLVGYAYGLQNKKGFWNWRKV